MIIPCPAKINFFIHVTGRRNDGYHTLDSLIGFADIGDQISIKPADHFSFNIDGPYSNFFSDAEKSSDHNATNLVVQTARRLAQQYNQTLDCTITLTKNLPLSSGIGGGSTNAAATVWGLIRYWALDYDWPDLQNLMLDIGADVPVCYACETRRVEGIGVPTDEDIYLPEIPMVFVNPHKPVRTPSVFKRFSSAHKDRINMPAEFSTLQDFFDFLKRTENQLTRAACEEVPEIGNVLNTLSNEEGCALARMSGSGATCFGLFETEEAAKQAKSSVQASNPDWWVRSGWIGRSARY